MSYGFVDEIPLITTTWISSCHWKTLVPFCLRKKKSENGFLTLTVNYCKIVQKNKLPSKTAVNWLFNDIWCYLFIACFDWKISIFQQTVVRVYYILNRVKLERAVPFIKYLATLVSLIFPPKILICNKITFRLSISLNLPELVEESYEESLQRNLPIFLFYLICHCLL